MSKTAKKQPKVKKISVAEELYLRQKGKCELCKSALTKDSHAVVDNAPWDKTQIRGLIHLQCKGIIKALENRALLNRAKLYLGIENVDKGRKCPTCYAVRPRGKK